MWILFVVKFSLNHKIGEKLISVVFIKLGRERTRLERERED